jgi:hypothetical protein
MPRRLTRNRLTSLRRAPRDVQHLDLGGLNPGASPSGVEFPYETTMIEPQVLHEPLTFAATTVELNLKCFLSL